MMMGAQVKHLAIHDPRVCIAASDYGPQDSEVEHEECVRMEMRSHDPVKGTVQLDTASSGKDRKWKKAVDLLNA